MEEISKRKIQLPKDYAITPEFSSILILGGERVVIDFEHPVNSTELLCFQHLDMRWMQQ